MKIVVAVSMEEREDCSQSRAVPLAIQGLIRDGSPGQLAGECHILAK